MEETENESGDEEQQLSKYSADTAAAYTGRYREYKNRINTATKLP